METTRTTYRTERRRGSMVLDIQHHSSAEEAAEYVRTFHGVNGVVCTLPSQQEKDDGWLDNATRKAAQNEYDAITAALTR